MKTINYLRLLIAAFVLVGAVWTIVPPSSAEAHPGGTDSRGCHTCRTNCARWGIPTGFYHTHNPVRPCGAPVSAPPPPPPAAQPTTSAPVQAPLSQPTSVPTPAFSTANSKVSTPATSAIANTGGSGVAARYDCSVDARSGTPGVMEGASVSITRAGTERCEDWYVVLAGSTETWVQAIYLDPLPSEPAVSAAPASSTTPSSTSTSAAGLVSETVPSASPTTSNTQSSSSDDSSAGVWVLLAGATGLAVWFFRRRKAS